MLKAAIESRTVTVIVTAMTIYALFGDDLRTALFKKGADPVFNLITVVCLAGFVVEICL